MSGGGKSTLINLIPRFYDVTDGEILIDQHNIKDFLTGSLRNQIGLVQQDNILFSDTVKENILLGRPDATDEEVVEAAKMANAHDFIMNLQDGYDTEVGNVVSNYQVVKTKTINSTYFLKQSTNTNLR